MRNRMKSTPGSRQQRGFSLMEVVIGIAVFAIGLLALASLQGALTRSMADAKARTVAVNIAEREIEQLRAFTILLSDGVDFAYNDIVDSTSTTTVEGVSYSITRDVTDYYYQLATDSMTTTSNGDANSGFKQVAVTVSWDGGSRSFRSVEGTDLTAAQLGTGSISVTAAIPAKVTSASALVADETKDGTGSPPITYQPGENPEVVSLSLGDNKFKESLTPVPSVYRTDELVETTFDVITYSSDQSGTFFLRREEFSAVSCECTLRAADADNLGRRPVIWAGDEYLGGGWVEKPYGESANNNQAALCDACCRDHHDGGTGAGDYADGAANRYGPFKPASEYVSSDLSNDHLHYEANGNIASAGDEYLEACRMTRVDGFWRVGQDFRREDQLIFPPDFLDDDAEIAPYSEYVTTAVDAYKDAATAGYESNPPCIGGPSPCVAEPDFQDVRPNAITLDVDGTPLELPSWTELDNSTGETAELRSRGIYIDYMSDNLREVIDCLDAGFDATECEPGNNGVSANNDVILDRTGSVNTLEIIPFFEVQRTFLDRWNETPSNTPVDTTNEAVETDNTHSRGVASSDALGEVEVQAKSHSGNLGFTDTTAIDPLFNDYSTQATLAVFAVDGAGGGGDPPPPTGDPVLGGALSETVAGSPVITVSSGGDAVCEQTASTWTCEVPSTSGTATVIISDYGKKNTDRYACSTVLSISSRVISGTGAYTTFILYGVAAGTSYNIVIQDTDCNL